MYVLEAHPLLGGGWTEGAETGGRETSEDADGETRFGRGGGEGEQEPWAGAHEAFQVWRSWAAVDASLGLREQGEKRRWGVGGRGEGESSGGCGVSGAREGSRRQLGHRGLGTRLLTSLGKG